MGTQHCQSAFPDTARLVRICWFLGCILSSIAYGVLLMLGQVCFVALRRQERRNPRLNKALAAYVLFTVILGTAAEVIDIVVTINGVFQDDCFSNNLQPQNPYFSHFAILFLLVNLTTDGLLVWRCYAVSRGLQGQKRLRALLWVLPAVVYIVMLGTGITVVTKLTISGAVEGFAKVLTPLQWAISAFLNILITSSIVVLILRYQRATLRAFGKDHPLPSYLNVMTVLIESASLNVVMDIFASVGVTNGSTLGNIPAQLWMPVQPIASLLIIYRVSRGSDYFNRQNEELSRRTLELPS